MENVYLQVGDKVFHKKFKSWGLGVVIEARSSRVPGGFNYARIQFQDGKKRVFDNSLNSASCCYYAGIALLERIEL
jgi:signal peptidase I